MANDTWLRPWDSSLPEEPLRPSLAKRLISSVRQTSAGHYAVALLGQIQARRGAGAHWVIWYDGQFAGQLTVFRIVWGPLRSAEVGYWVDERLAGRGIAPTALAMAIDHCFLVMRLHRIEACIQPQNAASRRAVEKLGFRDEGIRVGQVYSNGAWRDHVCYAITAEEVQGGLLPRWRTKVTAATVIGPQVLPPGEPADQLFRQGRKVGLVQHADVRSRHINDLNVSLRDRRPAKVPTSGGHRKPLPRTH
jgi:[ribosomal protein S5]-alanine N-acetyltransferase